MPDESVIMKKKNSEKITQKFLEKLKKKKTNLRVSLEYGIKVQHKIIKTNLFIEIVAEDFIHLGNEMNSHVRKAFSTPSRHDQKVKSPQHITVKVPETHNREWILKAFRAKPQITLRSNLTE